TQPSVVVNHLLRHHLLLTGAGQPQRSLHQLRRRALDGAGVYLPEITAVDFLAKSDTRALTTLHACFYVALSRLPVRFVPGLVGVHYAFLALGVDDLLTGTPPPLPEPELRDALTEYVALTQQSPNGPLDRQRLWTGVALVVAMEREHVTMLAELAEW